MTYRLDWEHPAAEIGDGGVAETRGATEAEREALAEALGLLACDAFSARYQIAPLRLGRFRLAGAIEAQVTQACVISLEPVAARIAETFSVELRPQEDLSKEAGERSVLGDGDVEPLEAGLIDVGRVVFEVLSAALDPYPRKPGAEFQWHDQRAEGDAAKGGPFAALAKLKRSQ